MKHRLKKIIFESLDKNKLYFNIKNELSFRVSQMINEKMLFEQNKMLQKCTPKATNNNLERFVSVIKESLQSKYPIDIKLNNGENISINSKEGQRLAVLFDNLNEHNRVKMTSSLFENSTNYKQILDFSKKLRK
jgi:hypothetical protein